MVGLPLHLWRQEVLKKIGDGCGGFLVIDEETTLRLKVAWARILVKIEGTVRPSVVNILEGARSFELQIWWEVPPKIINVYPSKVGKNQSQKERPQHMLENACGHLQRTSMMKDVRIRWERVLSGDTRDRGSKMER